MSKDFGSSGLGLTGLGDALTPSLSPVGTTIIEQMRAPSALVFNDEYLDCSYVGTRIVLRHPGMDRLKVEVAGYTAAYTGGVGAGVLHIRTALDESSRGDIPATAVDITSTAATQSQGALDITAGSMTWIEVATIQAGLVVRVKMTAMKS